MVSTYFHNLDYEAGVTETRDAVKAELIGSLSSSDGLESLSREISALDSMADGGGLIFHYL